MTPLQIELKLLQMEKIILLIRVKSRKLNQFYKLLEYKIGEK